MSAKSDEKCYRIAELYKLIFKRREIEQLVQHSLSQSYQTFLSGRRGSWSWYSAGALQIITHETFILCNFAAHDIWQFKNYVPWVFSPFGSLAQGLLGVLWLLSTFIPAFDSSVARRVGTQAVRPGLDFCWCMCHSVSVFRGSFVLFLQTGPHPPPP